MSDSETVVISENLNFYLEIGNLNFGDCVHINDNYDDIIISLDDWQLLKDAVDKLIADKE